MEPKPENPRDDPLHELYANPANIAPITNILYKELFAILYSNKKYSGAQESRNTELLARVANIAFSPKGSKVSEYVRSRGAVTQLEVETVLGIDRSTVSRTLSKLKSLQLVSEPAVIGSPYKDKNSRGAKVSVYLWYKADPRLCSEAQVKWAELSRIQETDRHAVKTNTPYRTVIDSVKDNLMSRDGAHPDNYPMEYIERLVKSMHPDLGSLDLSDVVQIIYNEIHNEYREAGI